MSNSSARFAAGPPVKRVWCAAALTLLAAASLRGESIWVEGEAAAVKEVTPNGWYDSVKKDVLSDGAWLSHFNDDRIGRAEYNRKVATGGAGRRG